MGWSSPLTLNSPHPLTATQRVPGPSEGEGEDDCDVGIMVSGDATGGDSVPAQGRPPSKGTRLRTNVLYRRDNVKSPAPPWRGAKATALNLQSQLKLAETTGGFAALKGALSRSKLSVSIGS